MDNRGWLARGNLVKDKADFGTDEPLRSSAILPINLAEKSQILTNCNGTRNSSLLEKSDLFHPRTMVTDCRHRCERDCQADAYNHLARLSHYY